MSDLSPFSVVERKLDFGDVRAAVDPFQTFLGRAATSYLCGINPFRSYGRDR
jgi:hypothetical protein